MLDHSWSNSWLQFFWTKTEIFFSHDATPACVKYAPRHVLRTVLLFGSSREDTKPVSYSLPARSAHIISTTLCTHLRPTGNNPRRYPAQATVWRRRCPWRALWGGGGGGRGRWGSLTEAESPVSGLDWRQSSQAAGAIRCHGRLDSSARHLGDERGGSEGHVHTRRLLT